MDAVYSVLIEKQERIIQVRKEIDELKEYIRQQDEQDLAVTLAANNALVKEAQQQVEILSGEIHDRARKSERGAKTSSLVGVFLCGCLLAAAVLLALWTHDSDPAEENAVHGGGGQVVVSLER